MHMPAKLTTVARLTLPRGRYRLRHADSQWPPERIDEIYKRDDEMSKRSHDEDMTTEYSDAALTVDDILADYLDEATVADTVPVFPAPPDTAVGTIAEMEAEARRIAAQAARQRYADSEFIGYEAFDGGEVSIAPEEDYHGYNADSTQTDYDGSEDDYANEYEPEPAPKKQKRSLFARSKKKAQPAAETARPAADGDYPEDEDDYASSFRDYNGDGSDYAPDGDYREPAEPEVFPPTFRDYLLSIVAGAFYRIRGRAENAVAQTMDDEDEDLGVELTPAQATRYYASHINSFRLRLRVSVVVWALMCYISLGFPVPGMLQYLPVAAAMCLAMQLTVMLLALDVVSTALLKIFRLRAGADTLAVISCLITAFDAVLVISGSATAHMPLCALSSLSLIGILAASLLSVRGLRKALRVPAIGKKVYSVSGEVNVKGSDITLLKSVRPVKGFVRRSEEESPDETLFVKATPFILILCLLLSLIIAVAKSDFYDILYIFSAVLTPAAPVAALLVFALPFFVGSSRIFSSGAAIAGWSGLCDIGQSRNLVVTDRDLFPDGSVEIESIRIFADEDAETVMAFAGTMIAASGCAMSSCLWELMEKNDCATRQVVDFEYLAGGGMKGVIDGHIVLCGGPELMRLMNVRIPFRLVSKTCVLLAIDGVLYGIFNMKYTALPMVRAALVNLMRSNRHPVFAIRDFNVTPEMLHDCFDVATDGYDFPPYIERFNISEAKPSDDSKIAAVVCREGLGPLVNMADTGRSIYVATRMNLLVTMLSAVIGMLTVFIKLLLSGSVELGFTLVFMLVWAIPVLAISFFTKS